ncbi:hypothetical protein [Massilia sp. CCM 8734]|uniref:restriction system modified-DNA reader domain-containing protein n=1 Tax=Massilia sp. CCM 8734 TaxID=2609283 RepID=UPI001422E4D8|nr:hypothetical protein [Massilia sp. CCM 8734]NHZ96801.1 hypothetical protein [Massilia sp. CCM 8734]
MDDGLKGHLEAIGDWLAGHRASALPTPSLSSDERKQLHVINKSIEQLSGLGVSIPDELRQLKLALSAKDVVPAVAVGAGERFVEIAELISALNKLSSVAETLHKQFKTPSGESIKRQRYDVTLKELIQNQYLSVCDKLEFSWKKDGQVFEGKVLASGALSAKTQSGWIVFDSLSAAADAISTQSLNGWLHWRRVNADGSMTRLKDIRAEFIKKGGAA